MTAPALPSGGPYRTEDGFGETIYYVSPADYRGLCATLARLGFDYPRSLSGSDMGYGLRVSLHLTHLLSGVRVTVVTEVPYDAAVVDSVTDLWGGVEWHEREAYDLVGITFRNHPDLRRILLEDDWTIHPLQKRYDTKGYPDPTWNAVAFPDPPIWVAAPKAPEAPKPAHGAPARAPSPAPADAARAARKETADAEQGKAGTSLPSADPAKAGQATPPMGAPADPGARANLASGAEAPLTTSERIVGATALDDQQKVGGAPGEPARGTTIQPGVPPQPGTGELTPAATTGGTGPTPVEGSAPAPTAGTPPAEAPAGFTPDPNRVRKPPKRWEPKKPASDEDGKEKP
ncbi:MAG TPA: NADH-quinone oxidoreductase subunit C, partial [Deinococcales bacterium]|nr:NADH-quinone oxidoreductase subunit C [Deinococcales bacterium]